jgi:hypothetical protein
MAWLAPLSSDQPGETRSCLNMKDQNSLSKWVPDIYKLPKQKAVLKLLCGIRSGRSIWTDLFGDFAHELDRQECSDCRINDRSGRSQKDHDSKNYGKASRTRIMALKQNVVWSWLITLCRATFPSPSSNVKVKFTACLAMLCTQAW